MTRRSLVMGWSFRRCIKVIPGVYLNVSKGGVSATVGVRGASLTFRDDGIYSNVGIPGSGLYNRQKIAGRRVNPQGPANAFNDQYQDPAPIQSPVSSPDYEYVSADPLDISSEGLSGFHSALLEANKQSQTLEQDLQKIKFSLLASQVISLLLKTFLLYFIVPSVKRWIDRRLFSQSQASIQVNRAIKESCVPLDIEMDDISSAAFSDFVKCFKDVMNSQFIWDVTSASDVDRVKTRSAAAISVSRRLTTFGTDSVPGISFPHKPAHLKNLNGADIFIYPGFFIMYNSPTDLGIIGLAELSVSFSLTQFVEQEVVPADSRKVGEVWERANKDGSRDKRYSDNRVLPLMEYGELTFKSSSGVLEKFLISNATAASRFNDSLLSLISAVSN